jgi:protein ImuB
MVACLLIPGFELRAALRATPGLALRPAALAPREGEEPLVGPVTSAAELAGVKPGMRMGEALATCPSLVLVEQDPAAAEAAWEGIVRRLEDAGFAVESAGLGSAYFETRGVERLYGGVEAALKRALAAVGSAWDPRAGAAGRRFAALAAANVARPGQVLIVADERTREFLAPLPLTLLPLAEQRRRELAELAETLEFPEAIGNELTLRRALAVLVDALLVKPERADRFLRKVALSATLVGGGSWRRTLTLRDPCAEPGRLRTALGPKLAELPAPVTKLKLEAVELTESTGQQLALVQAEGTELQGRLREGLRQVKASTGQGGVCSVVEVAPWSRIPEQRALLVARDD